MTMIRENKRITLFCESLESPVIRPSFHALRGAGDTGNAQRTEERKHGDCTGNIWGM